MYNAVIKSLIAAFVAIIAISITACSNSHKKSAEDLYNQAETALETNDYSLAIHLLDSIDSVFPEQVEIRRKGMHLRPQAIEKLSLKELTTTDSLIALNQMRCDSLLRDLEFVNNPVEGYYVAKSLRGKDVRSESGIYARMSPDGRFYLISSSLKPIKSTAIAVSANGSSARTPDIQYDGERNDRSMGAEVITFIQAEADTIGNFALQNPGALQLTFYGNSNYSLPLPEGQATALRQTYEASKALTDMKILLVNKTRLEKQLALARSQMARTFSEE